MRTLVAIAAGAVAAVVLWLVLVPWDLSEVDAFGRRRSGGDANAAEIAVVAIAVTVLAFAALFARSTRLGAAPFVAGGLGTWAALFAWRAGTAETAGANLFIVPLLFVVLPVALVVPLALRSIEARLPT